MIEQEILNTIYFGNTLQQYIIAIAIALISFIVLFTIKKVVVKHLKKLAEKTKNDIDDVITEQISKISVKLLFFFSIIIGSQTLVFKPLIEESIAKITLIVITYVIILQISKITQYVLNKIIEKKAVNKEEGTSIFHLISRFVNIIIWSSGLLIILSNFGFNITSIVAGLGIGGIAIAFAVQNILSDIFNSFAIYFDRPFHIGDFILVGEHAGVVEHIGIKSTRIKALRGELLIISNKEIMSSRIQNFKTLKKRRIVFNIGIVYETPVAKVKEIPTIIEEICKKTKHVEIDRVHFSEFGDSALVFEIVYYITDGNFAIYKSAQQEINLSIMEAFEKKKIEFAYPTRTIYTK